MRGVEVFPLLTARDEAWAQRKVVRTVSLVSAPSPLVQHESASRPERPWLYKYPAVQTGQGRRQLGRNVHFADQITASYCSDAVQ